MAALFPLFVMSYRASGPLAIGHCRTASDRALRRHMNQDIENLAVRAAPAIFVVLWSTGFISTKLALTGAEPFTWLTLRMAITICLLLVIVAITRPAWPKGSDIFHSAVAGLLVHGVYLAGVTIAIA